MKKKELTYNDLQDNIDALIGKFGLKKTIEVMASLRTNTEIRSPENERIKLLTIFVKSKTIEVFNLKEEDFYTSSLDEYKDARMASIYLIRKYTDFSFGSVAEIFQQRKRSVQYFYHKCEEILTIPSYYKIFMRRFTILEHHIINFIAKMK